MSPGAVKAEMDGEKETAAGVSLDSLPHHHIHEHRNIKIEPPLAYREQRLGASPYFSNQDATQEYLHELMWDKNELRAAAPSAFRHVTRLIDKEIQNVVSSLSASLCMPASPLASDADSSVEKVTMQEKIFVPVDKYPRYNFVGRILGPRGMTAKQLEEETGCKIMVRGRGSCRSEPLHVLITCEDTPSKVEAKLKKAVDRMNELLSPPPEGKDELKRKQLIELSIINGTFRPTTATKLALQAPRLCGGFPCGGPTSQSAAANSGFDPTLLRLLSDNKRRTFPPYAGGQGSASSYHHGESLASPPQSPRMTHNAPHGGGHHTTPAAPSFEEHHAAAAAAAYLKNAKELLEQTSAASANQQQGASGYAPSTCQSGGAPAAGWPFPTSPLLTDYYMQLLMTMSLQSDPSLLASLYAAPPTSGAPDLFPSLSSPVPSLLGSPAFPFAHPAALAAAAATGSNLIQPANLQQYLAAAAMLSNVPYTSSSAATSPAGRERTATFSSSAHNGSGDAHSNQHVISQSAGGNGGSAAAGGAASPSIEETKRI